MEEVVTLFASSIFYGLGAGVVIRFVTAFLGVLRRIWFIN